MSSPSVNEAASLYAPDNLSPIPRIDFWIASMSRTSIEPFPSTSPFTTIKEVYNILLSILYCNIHPVLSNSMPFIKITLESSTLISSPKFLYEFCKS